MHILDWILGVVSTSKLLSRNLVNHLLTCKVCIYIDECPEYKKGLDVLKNLKKDR